MKPRVFAKVAGLAAVPLLLALAQASLAAESPAKGNCVAVQKGWAGKKWTRATYEHYAKVFEAGGDHLGDFYDENLYFHDGPGYHGRKAMVDLYKGMRQNMKETVIPKTIVIDNDQGMIAVELTIQMEALRDSQTGPMTMKKGEKTPGSDGVLFYTLKDGCIVDIRGRMVRAEGQAGRGGPPGGPGGGPGGPGGPGSPAGAPPTGAPPPP